MPEVYRKKNGHSDRVTVQLCGHEVKVGGAGNRGGVEGFLAAGLLDASGVGNRAAVHVDEETEGDVPLSFAGVEPDWIMKGRIG